jgi:hypothetical protein
LKYKLKVSPISVGNKSNFERWCSQWQSGVGGGGRRASSNMKHRVEAEVDAEALHLKAKISSTFKSLSWSANMLNEARKGLTWSVASLLDSAALARLACTTAVLHAHNSGKNVQVNC